MNMRPRREELKIKLTVTADEHPELYRVLMAIEESRRRTRRLKDLAASGLLVERFGLPPQAQPQSPSSTGGEQAIESLGDVASLALWEERAG